MFMGAIASQPLVVLVTGISIPLRPLNCVDKAGD